MIFDWRDESLVEDAIESLDPYKITFRSRLVGIIGFDNEAEMVMHYLADTLPRPRRFDNNGMCAVLDPCRDPEGLQRLVDEEMDNVRFSIFGVALVHLADQETYRSLERALSDRRQPFVGEMPTVDF